MKMSSDPSFEKLECLFPKVLSHSSPLIASSVIGPSVNLSESPLEAGQTQKRTAGLFTNFRFTG